MLLLLLLFFLDPLLCYWMECFPDASIGMKQFAPLDIPSTMDAFLRYWRPNIVMLMESELWPNLIMSAARNGVSIPSH